MPPSGFGASSSRLADEKVGVAREVDERVRRSAVGGVRERAAVRGHAETEREHLVVQYAHGGHLLSRRLERLAVGVLVQLERLLEHVGPAELDAEPRERLAAARRDPELGMWPAARRPELEAPDPRHQIAPVVEVPV